MAAAQWQVAFLLGLAWTLTLLYGEWLQYPLHAPLCRDLLPRRTPVQRMDRREMEKHYTVAVIATPQVEVDSGRAVLVHQIRNDLQLRRRFRSSILSRASPDVIIILGNLFESSIPLQGPEWEASLTRYKHIFDPVIRTHGTRRSPRRKTKSIPLVRQIPGPVDVMQSASNMMANNEYFSQYSDAFKRDLSFVESLEGVVNLIGLNSAAAEGADTSHHTNTFWRFITQARAHAKEDGAGTQNVVLSPLPIFSPLGTSCFSLRHSFWLDTEVEAELSKNSTARLVSTLRPTFFISGSHEGETCWQGMQAPASAGGASAQRKTPWAEGNSSLQGGQILLGSFNPKSAYASAPFLLLSAPPLPREAQRVNGTNATSAASRLHLQLCITPSQLGLVLWYYILAVVSVSSLLLTPPRGPMPLDELARAVESVRAQLKAAKLKTENGEAAYVEALDAEGNMVAVPMVQSEESASQPVSVLAGMSSRETGPQQRTKHHHLHAGADLESGEGGGNKASAGKLGGVGTGQGSPKTSGLWCFPSLGVLRSRLLGAAGPLTVLLALQLAVYLSLLASDWA